VSNRNNINKYKQIEMTIGIIWIVYKKYEFLHLINKEQMESLTKQKTTIYIRNDNF
jgi:hypothetical protein